MNKKTGKSKDYNELNSGTAAELTQASHVANEIRRLIFDGEFQAGDGLNEQALANRFNVSRTPVREALRILTASGMVDQQPRKRARVATMPLGRIFESMEALSELEACCARLAVRYMTPIERAELTNVHEQFCAALCKKNIDVMDVARLNLLFHETLLEGCHNSALIEMARNLATKVIGYRAQQAVQPGRLKNSATEHGEILAALLSGDEERTYTLMRSHFDIVSTNVNEVVNNFNANAPTT